MHGATIKITRENICVLVTSYGNKTLGGSTLGNNLLYKFFVLSCTTFFSPYRCQNMSWLGAYAMRTKTDFCEQLLIKESSKSRHFLYVTRILQTLSPNYCLLTIQSLHVTWCTKRFNIQQLYALPTLYLCDLYLSENKQRLVPLTA